MKFDTISSADPHRADWAVQSAASASQLGNGGGADFFIRVEQPGNLIRIEMGGFFGDDDIGALQRTFEEKLPTLTCAPNQHLTLCDIRAMKIQTQEAVASFAKLVAQPQLRSKRLAFVTGSTLARMQAGRLTNRPGVEFFTDIARAESWLHAGE